MDGVWLIPDRQMNGAVANQRGVVGAVDTAAEIIATRARSRLAAHRDTGASHIEVEHHIANDEYGDIDSLVWLVDEPHARPGSTPSEANAVSIEFGHFTEWADEEGGRQWVPGLGILHHAAGLPLRDGMRG